MLSFSAAGSAAEIERAANLDGRAERGLEVTGGLGDHEADGQSTGRRFDAARDLAADVHARIDDGLEPTSESLTSRLQHDEDVRQVRLERGDGCLDLDLCVEVEV